MNKRNIFAIILLVITLIATVVVVALIFRDDAAKKQNGTHNTADVEFSQMVLLHSRGAVDMADLVAPRSQRSDIAALAQRIKATQAPDTQTVTAWLTEWNEPLTMGEMPGHGTMGMTETEDLEELEKLGGVDFNRAFLTKMIEHHQGVIDMAEIELKKGKFVEAKKMAQDMITSLTTELATIKQLLASL